MLRSTLARPRLLQIIGVMCAISACAGPDYVAANPADPNTIVCCTGVVRRLDLRADGTFEADLDPEVDRERWLRPGQTVLTCVQPDPTRNQFEWARSKLGVGVRARICGYWVRETLSDRNLILPITAVAPFVP